jgi:hypothetical protein
LAALVAVAFSLRLPIRDGGFTGNRFTRIGIQARDFLIAQAHGEDRIAGLESEALADDFVGVDLAHQVPHLVLMGRQVT